MERSFWHEKNGDNQEEELSMNAYNKDMQN